MTIVLVVFSIFTDKKSANSLTVFTFGVSIVSESLSASSLTDSGFGATAFSIFAA